MWKLKSFDQNFTNSKQFTLIKLKALKAFHNRHLKNHSKRNYRTLKVNNCKNEITSADDLLVEKNKKSKYESKVNQKFWKDLNLMIKLSIGETYMDV